MARQLSCIDLFAGAGGLAQGFKQAGWQVLCGIDNNPFAAQTFRLNFPTVFFCQEDIARLDPKNLLRTLDLRKGELDCLLGGPPCQSFSYNNHARSASGHRARLFQHYLRIVDTIRPQTLLMENVPGMLTIGNGRILAEIRSKLFDLGYATDARILFAEDYGVPQARRRLIILATRLGWTDALFPPGTHGPSEKPLISSNPHVHRWSSRAADRPKPLVTVWDAIGDLPAKTASRDSALRYSRAATTSYQRQARKASLYLTHHYAHNIGDRLLSRIRTIPEGGDWRDIPRRLLPAGMKRARPNDHTKRYGRLARRALCCTILTKCDPHWGSYIHPTSDRTITVREAARLQSFPDTFRFCPLISKQYEQIGNAVPPLLAAIIATSLSLHLVSS